MACWDSLLPMVTPFIPNAGSDDVANATLSAAIEFGAYLDGFTVQHNMEGITQSMITDRLVSVAIPLPSGTVFRRVTGVVADGRELRRSSAMNPGCLSYTDDDCGILYLRNVVMGIQALDITYKVTIDPSSIHNQSMPDFLVARYAPAMIPLVVHYTAIIMMAVSESPEVSQRLAMVSNEAKGRYIAERARSKSARQRAPMYVRGNLRV